MINRYIDMKRLRKKERKKERNEKETDQYRHE